MIRPSLAFASNALQSLMATVRDQQSLKLVLCAKTSEVGTGKTGGATDLGLSNDATIEIRPWALVGDLVKRCSPREINF